MELEIRSGKGDNLCGLFSGELIENQGVRYFLTVMLDITARKKTEIEYQKTIQELRIALSEIKTLRGILPICVNCKKIRDDKGYWEQVESYVTNHTEAMFSHGICPECFETLYPEFADEEDV